MGTCTVSLTAPSRAFMSAGLLPNPELCPAPGFHEGSSGHVVAHRWPKWGSTCHQARLAFGYTVQVCAGACAPAARRPKSATASVRSSSLWSERERILICGSSKRRVGRPPVGCQEPPKAKANKPPLGDQRKTRRCQPDLELTRLHGQLAPVGSNHHSRIQSPVSCHWTRGQRRCGGYNFARLVATGNSRYASVISCSITRSIGSPWISRRARAMSISVPLSLPALIAA